MCIRDRLQVVIFIFRLFLAKGIGRGAFIGKYQHKWPGVGTYIGRRLLCLTEAGIMLPMAVAEEPFGDSQTPAEPVVALFITHKHNLI